jgi:hypothetical protein
MALKITAGMLFGLDYVLPEHLAIIAPPVLLHRLSLCDQLEEVKLSNPDDKGRIDLIQSVLLDILAAVNKDF